MKTDRKKHWEHIYQTKTPDQVSWTQQKPETSLEFIHSLNLNKNAKIIDIGGGDSKLVDYLLEEGFEQISVLDISAKALEKARKRLGDKAKKVNWIVCDITEFNPETTFDLWHDRAAFHFLTSAAQIESYKTLTKKAVEGYLILGTFSKDGPEKCSGLNIQQYSEKALTAVFEDGFDKIYCMNKDHLTPFHTTQNFLFCSFKKAAVTN